MDHLYIFTNQGHLIYRPVHELSDLRWKETGQHLSQSIGLNPEEEILTAFIFPDLKQTGRFVLATSDGYIKQVDFQDLLPGRTYRSRALKTMKLHHPTNKIVQVFYLPRQRSDLQVLGFTENSYALLFDLNEVPVVGAQAAGVKFLALKEADQIVDFAIVDPQQPQFIVLLTKRGNFKKMSLSEITPGTRARRGTLVMRELKKQPHQLQCARVLTAEEVLTVITDKLATITIDPQNFNFKPRSASGTGVLNPTQDGVPLYLIVHSRLTTASK